MSQRSDLWVTGLGAVLLVGVLEVSTVRVVNSAKREDLPLSSKVCEVRFSYNVKVGYSACDKSKSFWGNFKLAHRKLYSLWCVSGQEAESASGGPNWIFPNDLVNGFLTIHQSCPRSKAPSGCSPSITENDSNGGSDPHRQRFNKLHLINAYICSLGPPRYVSLLPINKQLPQNQKSEKNIDSNLNLFGAGDGFGLLVVAFGFLYWAMFNFYVRLIDGFFSWRNLGVTLAGLVCGIVLALRGFKRISQNNQKRK